MGADRHPAVEIDGALQALREVPGDYEIVLVGDRSLIEAELARHEDVPHDRLSIIHTAERIEPNEAPATAVRRKSDSSIVVGLGLQKRGEADAFVSAGSTGAIMAASHFLLRPLPGVARPTVATVLPTSADPIVMVDAGANVDSKPFHLLQFAQLGSIYARDVLRRPRPRVGLLNIGEEPEKGDELAVQTYKLLEASDLEFVGNVEGRDVIAGGVDVLVTDGFVGNVLLKFYESVAGFFIELLKRELARTGVELELTEIFRALDYTEYGGAPLLGVNGISIICHGGSPPRAVSNAIRVAIRAVETDMVGNIRSELATVPEGGNGAHGPLEGHAVEGA